MPIRIDQVGGMGADNRAADQYTVSSDLRGLLITHYVMREVEKSENIELGQYTSPREYPIWQNTCRKLLRCAVWLVDRSIIDPPDRQYRDPLTRQFVDIRTEADAVRWNYYQYRNLRGTFPESRVDEIRHQFRKFVRVIP